MSLEGKLDFLRVIAAWFLPPLGVFLQVGLGLHFWINLVLTLLFVVPGSLHALWVIASVGTGGRAAPRAGSTFLALVLAGVLPPVSVLIRVGFGLSFLVNCVCCLFFWIPGVLHAVWVVTHASR